MATVPENRMQNVSKKVQIVACWLLCPDFERKTASDAIGFSTEYCRQVINDLESEEREMVADYELEAAQDRMLQAEIGRRLREAGAITDAPTTVEVNVDDLRREIGRLSTLEESAKRGDEERAWIAASARAFLEELMTAK